MTDYIIAKKDYDPSLKEIALDKVIDLKNIAKIDLLKVEILDVLPLGEENVTRDTIKVPTNLKTLSNANTASAALSQALLKVNGFALVELKITAVDTGMWDSDLQSKTIRIKLGSPFAKMKQEIADLKKQNKQALVKKEQEIANLKKQNEVLAAKNQELTGIKKRSQQLLEDKDQLLEARYQRLKDKDQKIADLKKQSEQALASKDQELKSLQHYRENAAKMLEEAKSVRQTIKESYSKSLKNVAHEYVKSLNAQGKSDQAYKVLTTILDAIKHADKTIDTELKLRWLSEYDEVKRVFAQHYSSGVGRELRYFAYTPNRTTYSEKRSTIRFANGYWTTFEDNVKEKLFNYTFDPEAAITVKKSFTISQPVNITEIFEFPKDTATVLVWDHAVGYNSESYKVTARLLNPHAPDDLEKKRTRYSSIPEFPIAEFKDYQFAPGKPGTKNMFTIAAKLSSGKITKPITFLSETPTLAGGK